MGELQRPRSIKRDENIGVRETKLSRPTIKPTGSIPTKVPQSITSALSKSPSKSLIGGKVHAPPSSISRMRPPPSIKLSPKKKDENIDEIPKRDERKSQNINPTNFSKEISCNSSPRRPFSSRIISLNSNKPKSCVPQDAKYHQRSPNSMLARRITNMNPRNIRKAINVDTFLPNIRTEKFRKNSDVHVGDKSLSPQRLDNSFELSDWEFIDWPWVTPYVPLKSVILLSDIKPLEVFSIPKPKIYAPFCQWIPISASFYINKTSDEGKETQIQKPRNLPFCFRKILNQCKTSTEGRENEFKLETKISSNQENPSFQQRELTISDPALQNHIHDSTITPVGPDNLENNQTIGPTSVQKTQDFLSSNTAESCSRVLLEIINEIMICVAQMRKGDRHLIEELLKALRDFESCDRSLKGGSRDLDENHKANKSRNSPEQLNPNVAEFKPQMKYNFMGSAEISMRQSQQSINLERPPLQTVQACNIYKENSENGMGQVIPGASSAKIKQTRPASNAANFHPESVRQNFSLNKKNNIEEKLAATCFSKIHKLESELQRQSLLSKEMKQNFHPPYYAEYPVVPVNQTPFDIQVMDDGPGREANALEQNWAVQMLEKFRGKYPMTGTIKSDLITNVKKKLASDIQQRLEYLLLVKKENNACQQLCLRELQHQA